MGERRRDEDEGHPRVDEEAGSGDAPGEPKPADPEMPEAPPGDLIPPGDDNPAGPAAD